MSRDASRQSKVPAETTYTRMGQLLGMPLSSEADALRVARAGIPASQFVAVARRLHLTIDSIGAASTIRRRLKDVIVDKEGRVTGRVGPAARASKTNSPEITPEALLTPGESERLVRLARVYSEATQLFGEEGAALAWLNTPGDYLQDGVTTTPMKLAETDSGARIVESLLQRTAYGVF